MSQKKKDERPCKGSITLTLETGNAIAVEAIRKKAHVSIDEAEERHERLHPEGRLKRVYLIPGVVAVDLPLGLHVEDSVWSL